MLKFLKGANKKKNIQKKVKKIESACWRNCETKLEDVMNMGSETTLHIFAFRCDDFSGAKKYFELKSYTFSC